ncbi:hypothetical protein EMGBD1_21760 [Anaerolineaceae bacterium]|nr:hypothetical protein EMGBD1_21760 [Anaerolineaceae bacterium]
MPKTTLEQVREFHETYGLPVKAAPDLSDARINGLRVSLLTEELEEFKPRWLLPIRWRRWMHLWICNMCWTARFFHWACMQ